MVDNCSWIEIHVMNLYGLHTSYEYGLHIKLWQIVRPEHSLRRSEIQMHWKVLIGLLIESFVACSFDFDSFNHVHGLVSRFSAGKI